MSASPPLVSIGLLTYNSSSTLRRALDALVAQDYPNIEMIIFDDASSDDSYSICLEYAERHEFIRVHRNPENLGVKGNLFQLRKETRGEYFLWACPDDWWTPDFISTLVTSIESTAGSIAALSAVEKVHRSGETVINRLTGIDDPANLSTLRLMLAIASRRNSRGGHVRYNAYIHGLIRARCFWEATPENLSYLSIESPALLFLALMGRLVFVDRVLFRKYINDTPVNERNPDDPLASIRGTWTGMLKAFVAFLYYVFRSRRVTTKGKLLAAVAVFPAFIHRMRQLIWRFRMNSLGSRPARLRSRISRSVH